MYPVLFSIGSWEVRSTLFFLVLGVLAGGLFGRDAARRLGYSNRDYFTLLAGIVPVALLLADLNGLLFWLGLDGLLENLLRPLAGGLVSFGAILGAFFVGWLFTVFRRQAAGLVLDQTSLTLILILAIYRIGCLLNGCCYGLETDGPLGVYLPGGAGLWAYRYPTQIMLIIFDLLLFIWLLVQRSRKPAGGRLTLSFLLIYSIGRLLIDALRDLPHVLGPFSAHQLAALAILLVTLYIYFELWLSRRRQDKGETRPGARPA